MAQEILTYGIEEEVRSGPWGLIRRRKRIEQLSEGDSSTLPIDTGQIELTLEYPSQALIIKSESPIVVEFGAEPERFKPKVVAKLNELEPETSVAEKIPTIYPGSEISTGRRYVTIYPTSNPSHRLILKAPNFQPLLVTRSEAGALWSKAIQYTLAHTVAALITNTAEESFKAGRAFEQETRATEETK